MTIYLDVKKAVEYASAWAIWNNPHYITVEGNDCTNFVSQCWHEAGIPLSPHWSNDLSTSIYTPAWTEVGTFHYYMTTSAPDLDPEIMGNFPVADEVALIETPLNDYTGIIKPADIVQCYNESNGWHHSIIIMDLVNGMPRYCAHSSFANYMDLTVQFSALADSPNSKIRVIRARNRINA